jgi:hypothetical protein
MKNIKLLTLMMAVLPFFASCSDDDDVNTGECTVGFASNAITVDETAGYVQIPINVSGHRNGPVQVKIESAAAGENGAVEGEHYAITDKSLNLNSDTLSTGTINVEVKIIDDSEINSNRQFTLTIASAAGAEITTQQTTVTISDNDADFYKAFAGVWTFSATNADGATTSFPVTIKAADKGSADYEKVLTCEAANILGAGETYSWKLEYMFDQQTLSGQLGLVCGEEICYMPDYGYHLMWLFSEAGNRQNVYQGVFPIDWKLTEEGTIPDTLTLDPAFDIWLYAQTDDGQGGYMDIYNKITLTRN